MQFSEQNEPSKIVPIGVSNRHIHLSQKDADSLFGKDYQFVVLKPLSQYGQFAYNETLTLTGPKGSIHGVRVLGPCREETQVELLKTDAFTLGIQVPLRLSGDLAGTPGGITITGPAGNIDLTKGVIIAKRHLHIPPKEAEARGLHPGETIKVRVGTTERGLTFDNVLVRVTEASALDFHIDTEEGNAAGVKTGDTGEIIS